MDESYREQQVVSDNEDDLSKHQQVVVYEVNAFISREIAESYEAWIQKHVRDILTIDGFFQAQILIQSEEDTDYVLGSDHVHFSIRYLVRDADCLQTYFEKYAVNFRREGEVKWGSKVSYKRRIYKVLKIVEKETKS